MSIFEGSVTPFKENGEVDFDKMKELVEFHIANGTDAIIVCGTTGEASTLSHEEHLACIKACVEYVDHRIPVIAGAGSNCTGTAIYLSTEAESYGVDGLLLVTPYYNKATQNGLIAHFTAIANSVKIPIILYNVPSRTGCNIQPETAVTLAKTVPNIVGIKEASGNIAQVVKLAKLADGCIDIYSGNDDQVVPLLSLGKYNRDRLTKLHDTGIYKTDQHDRSCCRTLNDRCYTGTKTKALNRAGCLTLTGCQFFKYPFQTSSCQILQGIAHHVHSKQEQSYASK